MKKVIAINGSPRRNGNTASLLQEALNGAAEAGAQTELVQLYSLNFKGCISCFACKLKSREHGTCAMRDDLSPVLERVKEADALIMGSPIYFMNITSGLAAFIERLMFSNYIYSNEIPTVFPKKLPNAYIYTMNATEEQAEQFGLAEKLGMYSASSARILGADPEVLCAYDTYQFKDYSKYESSIFDPVHKAEVKDRIWPENLKAAFNLGKRLVSEV